MANAIHVWKKAGIAHLTKLFLKQSVQTATIRRRIMWVMSQIPSKSPRLNRRSIQKYTEFSEHAATAPPTSYPAQSAATGPVTPMNRTNAQTPWGEPAGWTAVR
eukprot:52659_1